MWTFAGNELDSAAYCSPGPLDRRMSDPSYAVIVYTYTVTQPASLSFLISSPHSLADLFVFFRLHVSLTEALLQL